MKLGEFIKKIKNLPVIESEILVAGEPDPESIKVQLSRWKQTKKLTQLKRGVYLLAEPYRSQEIFAPYVANVLKKPSYISLEKAMEFHGLIPEAVHIYTCVTTKRPGNFVNEVGTFQYRHIQKSLFWGYESIDHKGQTAFMAKPEKTLLDFFYLNHIKISLDYLEELRLQNVENINLKRLFDYADRFKKPGMVKCAQVIADYVHDYTRGEKKL